MSNLLITGGTTGVGRALIEHFSEARTLSPGERVTALRGEVATVVHCGIERRRRPRSYSDLRVLIDESLEFTQELLALGARRFVFLSSMAVHRATDAEDLDPGVLEPLDSESQDPVGVLGGGGTGAGQGEFAAVQAGPGAPQRVVDLHASLRYAAESRVRAQVERPLILRCSTLLGPTIARNSALRIVEERDCELTLSADSELNLVCVRDLIEFLERGQERDLAGTYNIASAAGVTLAEVARHWARTVRFGTIRHRAGRIDNSASVAVLPALGRTSLETLEAYIGRG